VFERFATHMMPGSSQAERYQVNGFVAAFCLNINGQQFVNVNLSQAGDVAGTLRSRYAVAEGEGEQVRPDVIVVLSEAWFNLYQLEGYNYSKDPMENYHRMVEDGAQTGKMLTPTLGGGTIQPEFEVLTGGTTTVMPEGAFPYQQYVVGKTWSFAHYFKELAYKTIGVHSFDASFYERDRAYPLLGFDAYYGLENLHVPVNFRGRYASDDTLANEVVYQLANAKEGEPLFLYAISMENHGMYYQKYTDEDMYVKVERKDGTETELLVMENYASGVKHADDMLGKIYDYIKGRSRPTVLLVFGDHLPALADNFYSYLQGGMVEQGDSALWTEEERLAMFSTPYILYANYDVEAAYRAQGEIVNTSFLLPLLCDWVGLPESGIGNFLLDYYEKSKYQNTRIRLENKQVDTKVSAEYERFHMSLTKAMLGHDPSVFKALLGKKTEVLLRLPE